MRAPKLDMVTNFQFNHTWGEVLNSLFIGSLTQKPNFTIDFKYKKTQVFVHQ